MTTTVCALGAGAVLVVGLVGCSTGKPVTNPTPTAAPSSTATPEAVSDPMPTLAVTCAGVLTNDQASGYLGSRVTLKVDQAAVSSYQSVAALDSGLLNCVWGGESKTDNSWDVTIDLDVIADAAADYATNVTQVDDGAVDYTAGDTSEYLCGDYGVCRLNLLSHGYWAHAYLSSNGPDGAPSRATIENSARELLDSLAGTITAAPAAGRPWSRPSDAVSGRFCDDEAPATAVIQAAFSEPGATVDPSASQLDPLTPDLLAQERAGMVACSWSDGNYSVAIVPGGGWAFPEMLKSPPKVNYMYPPLVALDVPGHPSVIGSCVPGDGCVAYVPVGGSLVSVSAPTEQGFGSAVGQVADAVALSR
ncbi:hypothetical protein E6C70_03495 [Glaciibacter flavus]|uniref:DUF3558 domain-containing protein n=1 Tax=Orlajensenia flava TaxID=2565934 RepID=A0A4S4FYN3_9MICO|nr:hypothetical protein [Glaciibacter flavus]THG35145.1 hypothetical protein E6C70_03495 [Glaciibacter flavus]